MKKREARITATGSYLPDRVLTNKDLEGMVETSDEWIVSRTGMRERRLAAEHESTSDLGLKAARRALEAGAVSPSEVEMIIVATSTPDYLFPSTAALIQSALGAENAGGMDIQAACTGFLYALSLAKGYIESGAYRTVLVIAADKLSAFVDYEDRTTCVLFGDGAAAAVVRDKGAGFRVRDLSLGCDGKQEELLIIRGGGSRHPTSSKSVEAKMHYIEMQGKEVFKHAVRRMEGAAQACLEHTGLKESEIDWVVPHQANERIIGAIAKRFHVPDERVFRTVHKYGNTSASSMLIAFDELQKEQEIAVGENLLLVAFGAGFTWGATILTKERG